ncbi:unnamed protein product [Parnassius mnemosyne]|uniref:Endonuclease/exonuclease/phosphatase domain-containing protein n=1 Tax=Parnassius mnemosyne TaxID=213953 RepID=A0AAV1K3X4_9NEOP
MLQCNLGRGYAATHELKQYIVNKGYDIVFITEPYVGKNNTLSQINGYSLYQHSKHGSRVKACIAIKNNFGSCLGINQCCTTNLCTVQLSLKDSKLLLICAYVEPDVDEENTLNHLEQILKTSDTTRRIICGDFNGWHTTWGSNKINKRGKEIMDLIMANELNICNTGSHPTFETTTHGQLRTSIVDLTLASDNIVSNVRSSRYRLYF